MLDAVKDVRFDVLLEPVQRTNPKTGNKLPVGTAFLVVRNYAIDSFAIWPTKSGKGIKITRDGVVSTLHKKTDEKTGLERIVINGEWTKDGGGMEGISILGMKFSLIGYENGTTTDKYDVVRQAFPLKVARFSDSLEDVKLVNPLFNKSEAELSLLEAQLDSESRGVKYREIKDIFKPKARA